MQHAQLDASHTQLDPWVIRFSGCLLYDDEQPVQNVDTGLHVAIYLNVLLIVENHCSSSGECAKL